MQDAYRAHAERLDRSRPSDRASALGLQGRYGGGAPGLLHGEERLKPLLSPLLLLVLPWGCAPDAPLVHVSAFQAGVVDVVVGESPSDLHLTDSRGAVFRVDTTTGDRIERFEPDGEAPEVLHDVDETMDPAALLASGPGAVYLWDGVAVSEPLSAEERDGGVLGARFAEAGLAVLRLDPSVGCVVEWVLADDVRQTLLPGGACTEPCVVAARAENRLLVTARGTTWSVGPQALDSWTSGGGLCAYDEALGVHAVAAAGTDQVVATTAQGDPLWSLGLPSQAVALGDLGEQGGFVVSGARGTEGQLVVLDSETGEPMALTSTPVPGSGISAGGAEPVVVLWLPTEVHVFDLRVAW